MGSYYLIMIMDFIGSYLIWIILPYWGIIVWVDTHYNILLDMVIEEEVDMMIAMVGVVEMMIAMVGVVEMTIAMVGVVEMTIAMVDVVEMTIAMVDVVEMLMNPLRQKGHASSFNLALRQQTLIRKQKQINLVPYLEMHVRLTRQPRIMKWRRD